MIDLSHIPEIPGLRVFLPQGVDANSWQTWQKPRGFVMATIYAIGPGGGGGSGRAASVASGTDRGGGAGGGSGGLSRLTIPLFLLPDTLYIRVTPGGSGGASANPNANGTNGNVAFAPLSSLVACYPSTTAQYLFLRANAGNGGVAGTNIGNSAAGTGASISTTAESPLSSLSATLFIAGNNGGNGGGNTLGSSITQGTANQIYGGAGGGGVGSGTVASFAGGSISALSNTPFAISPGGASATFTGGNGFSWTSIFPLKIYGGTGGASNGGGNGGAGGNGAAPGAGGGGGGGAGDTSGRGGDGGPGCVIIQCW